MRDPRTKQTMTNLALSYERRVEVVVTYSLGLAKKFRIVHDLDELFPCRAEHYLEYRADQSVNRSGPHRTAIDDGEFVVIVKLYSAAFVSACWAPATTEKRPSPIPLD